MPPENASSATQWPRQCVEVDCLLVPCGVARRCSHPVVGGTRSRVESLGRAPESPLDTAVIVPGAKRHRAKQASVGTHKYRAVLRRCWEELATGLLQSVT